MFHFGILQFICWNLLRRAYYRPMQWVGLEVWGRCVSYVRENCTSYACKQIAYHIHATTRYYMHVKVNFCISIARFSVFIWHNFICIFRRPDIFTFKLPVFMYSLCVHTYRHIYIYIYIYTHTHIHTYSISQKWVLPSHFCKYFIIFFHVTTLKKWHFATM